MLALASMLSVVIPTKNDELRLVHTLASLVPAAAEGTVRDVTVADAGSTDETLKVADLAGCDAFVGGPARGGRLDAAARGAKGQWLMFLEPGVVLEEGWAKEARALVEALERRGEAGRRAAVFRFGRDRFGGGAGLGERLAGLPRLIAGLPRPEQGLIVHKSLYERVGGFRALSAMEHADLIRRIGPRRLVRLRSRALAPRSGLADRSGPKAAIGAGLLMLRVPPSLVARLYG